MSTDVSYSAACTSAQKLFALDIGTRSVVGIILEQHGDTFHVIDILAKEHKERAMVDGQIHNVLFVAQLITEIKEQLEHKHGSFTSVSVAAAGRALKTEQGLATIDIRQQHVLDEEDVHRLELQAVQHAQQALLEKRQQSSSHYYCVGYSVLYYRLDGDEIGSLIDQQGDTAQVEVIATFLPRVVVESLLAALKRAGLEMEALTLEPIAAINVLIPPSMRRLNVALVDIGAGTSDIAITDKDTVVAYGMVPTAGDEITEALSDHYLLDFHVAEQAKRDLSQHDNIILQDILGFDQTFSREEVCTTLQPAVQHLATAIGQEILRLNGQTPPKAVMLIGGGSLTPSITTELAHVLQLPANRVAVRDLKALQNITYADSIPMTPELVTPIGIAIAAKRAPIHYMSITVNERVIRLFEVHDMTVSDALLAANIAADDLYGEQGEPLLITLNGQSLTLPGTRGEPATVHINGQPASMKAIIRQGDSITLHPGQRGHTPTVRVADLLDEARAKVIHFQQREYVLEPTVIINDVPASLETVLQQNDHVAITLVDTIADFLTVTAQQSILEQVQPYMILLDGKPLTIPEFSAQLLLNERRVKAHYPLQHGDQLSVTLSAAPTAQMIADYLNIVLEDHIHITFQQQALSLHRTITSFSMNGVRIDTHSAVPSGAVITTVKKESSPWQYQDVFRYSSWQLPTDFKGTFAILRNGERCGFDEPIFGGDTLEIQLQPQTI